MKKRQKETNEIAQKIISMYARGLSTRQISSQVEDIYGFNVSEGTVSDITNKILPEIELWQHNITLLKRKLVAIINKNAQKNLPLRNI